MEGKRREEKLQLLERKSGSQKRSVKSSEEKIMMRRKV